MYGDMESHAERYARTREFIAVMRDLWSGEPVDHDSERYPFRGAIVSPIPADPVPIYLGGHSERRKRLPRSSPTSIWSGATHSRH
jgi:alkanesulfonate monooxygenase SsuD/methylene tetrahydromethanopterin reductase-like flavin-dependent oxidoreductase (luciferase family)